MKIRKFINLCLYCIFFYGIARFCHHATQGFSASKLHRNLLNDLTIERTHQKEDEESIETLLEQPFSYLARGKQSFVFLSQDEQYVIKVFSNAYPTKYRLLTLLCQIPILQIWARTRACYFKEKMEKTLQSYRIAFEEMRDQTALIYTHLHQTTHLQKSLILIDPLGIKHTFDPNAIGFLIQKRATLFYPTLKQWMQEDQFDAAKAALSSLVELFFWKYAHGIADNDPLIRTNYGVINGKAVQLDVGPLSKDTRVFDIEFQRNDIKKITTSLKWWIKENAPILLPVLEEELQSALNVQP